MNENTLMKFSLIVSLLGIFALFIISEFLPNESNIYTAGDSSRVSLKGKITNIEEHPNNVYEISILPYSKTKVILFEKQNLNENDSIEVVGRVDDYRGTREIIAEEIRKI